MFGMDGDDSPDLLENLMQGRLKDGFQKDDVTMKIKKSSTISDYVHSVILLFSYENLNNEEEIRKFRSLYC